MKPRLPAAPMTPEDRSVWSHFYLRRVRKGRAYEWPYLPDCMQADHRDAEIMLALGTIPHPREWAVYPSIAHEQIKLGQLTSEMIDDLRAAFRTEHKRAAGLQ